MWTRRQSLVASSESLRYLSKLQDLRLLVQALHCKLPGVYANDAVEINSFPHVVKFMYVRSVIFLSGGLNIRLVIPCCDWGSRTDAAEFT